MRRFSADPPVPRRHAKTARVVLFAGVLLAAGPPAAPWAADLAQVGPPLILTPPPEPGTEPAPPLILAPPPEPLPDSATPPPIPVEQTAPEGERAPAGIEVDPLGIAAADGSGLLEPDQGGLGLEMWRGTGRAAVELLLQRLPAGVASPAMHDLARRLLMSNATPPEGAAGANLTLLRVERLVALGDTKDAAALMALLPEREVDGAAARLGLDAMLLSGDADGACTWAEALIRQLPDEAYLQQALIFCQARAGRANEAMLGLDLMREQGQEPDTTFVALVEAVAAGQGDEVELPENPDALHLAMLQAAGQALPPALAASGRPEVLALLTKDPKLEAATRIDAAERGLALGIVPPETVIQLYLDMPTQPGELEAALQLPDAGYGAQMRAVLYQAAARSAQPAPRAQLLERALQLARRQGRYLASVAVNRALLMDLAPRPEIAWLAEEAARALYAAGRYEQATAWIDLARTSNEPKAEAARPALALLARIAGGTAVTGDSTGLAPALAGGPDDASAGERAARILSILEAFGARGSETWAVPAAAGTPAEGTRGVDPVLWFALGDAAADGRVGETVLLALVGLGPEGPAGANPIVLYRVLDSLRRIGLEREARALAFEAAIASGA